MESAVVFNDLPGIAPDFDTAVHVPYRGQGQGSHSSYSIRTLKASQGPYESVMGFQETSYSQPVEYPVVLPVKNDEDAAYNSVSYHTGHAKTPWYSFVPEPPVRPGGYCSWTPGLVTGNASPSPSFTDGSASDDGSNVASSQWSADSTGKDPFNEPNHPLSLHHASPRLSSGDASCRTFDHGTYLLPESASRSNNCSGSGIKMEDVQQYPDSYPDDHFDEMSEHANGAMRVGASDLKTGPYSPPEDQPSSPSSYHDNIKEESMEEDDGDDASDYTPRSRRKPRDSRATRSRNHADKATSRFSRRSNSGRVSKRYHKAVAAAESVPPSSNRISCPHCSQLVHSKVSLNKHIATAHTRPFTCTFREYGCMSTFGSKNEWKRHVSSQHLRLGFWRCQLGRCFPHQTSDVSGAEEDEELIFNDFNRKDLFTQHLRRMHAPHASSSAAEKARFHTSLDRITQDCFIAVRSTPPRSVCGYCTTGEGKEQIFQGAGAWEARMEHVGRHLESGHGEERAWAEDQGLKRWLIGEGLIECNGTRGWRLVGLQADDRGRRR